MASDRFYHFPPVRACIFDLDGLLINSEDMITTALNELIRRHGLPDIPRCLRVQLMGVPDSTSSDAFHDWARLPVSRTDFDRDLATVMHKHFQKCEPLVGAQKLLSNLSQAYNCSTGAKIELALASSTKTSTYKEKTFMPETKRLLDMFDSKRQILGDDYRVPEGRSKPAPDIYRVALKVINATADPVIKPEECLVFEDSVVGIEAGRRAGMRVIWVPHRDVVAEWHSGVVAKD